MSRLMSVAYTEAAVVARTKTVTRRKGWWKDSRGRHLVKPGDRITLCRKVMGRRRCCPGCQFDEPLVRLCEVEVVDVRREQLSAITQEEVALEGFPEMDPAEFVNRFFVDAQGIWPHEHVTRIEWRYLDETAAEAPA